MAPSQIDAPRGPAQRRLRVAAILDTWIVSGPGRQLAALAGALKPLGVDLKIFMFQREGRATSPYIGYLEELGVDHAVIHERGRLDLTPPRALAALLAEFKPDIVQTHGYRPTGLIRLLRLRPRPWRWIGFFHGATRQDVKDALYNRLNFMMLRGAEQLVVLSAEHKEWFAALGGRVRIIHNACLALPMAKTPLDLAHLRQKGRLLVGVVARLSHEKGVDLLIDVVAPLRALGTDLHLVIAGDGPEEAALRRRAAAGGIAETVHFLGRIEDVMGLYRQLDLLVIPSRSGAEGLPNVLLEAMSADLPVVATRVAAIPEVLGETPAGRVVAPGDVAGLEGAIRELIVNRPRAMPDGRS
jgi:glycosyltransferase involved in cell wall biosynthesis